MEEIKKERSNKARTLSRRLSELFNAIKKCKGGHRRKDNNCEK